MRAHWKKKTVVLTLALTLVVGGGGAAFAYWTTTGNGTGSATTGTAGTITANQTSTITNLGPGVDAQTLSGNFTNTTSGPVYVGTVTVAIASVTQASGATGTCSADDYTLSPTVMNVGHEVATGTGVDSWTGATIQFKDKTTTNQDGCKGATVNLEYTIG